MPLDCRHSLFPDLLCTYGDLNQKFVSGLCWSFAVDSFLGAYTKESLRLNDL